MKYEILAIWGMLSAVGMVGLGVMISQYRAHLAEVNKKLTAARELANTLQSENASLHLDLLVQEQVCDLTQEIIKIVRNGTEALPSEAKVVD